MCVSPLSARGLGRVNECLTSGGLGQQIKCLCDCSCVMWGRRKRTTWAGGLYGVVVRRNKYPHSCVLFCRTAYCRLLSEGHKTEKRGWQMIMGSGCQDCQMSKPNLDTLPRQQHTHTHTHTQTERERELACPSGSEGTDGPTKHCTADPCSHPAHDSLGGKERCKAGKGRKEPPRVTSRAKSLPGSRVQALQDLRA